MLSKLSGWLSSDGFVALFISEPSPLNCFEFSCGRHTIPSDCALYSDSEQMTKLAVKNESSPESHLNSVCIHSMRWTRVLSHLKLGEIGTVSEQ